jgi:hypothetical protein
MSNNSKKHLEHLKQGQAGRFLFSQLTHTAITLSVLALLLVGARQVGALNGLLAPAAPNAPGPSSTTTILIQGRLADSNGVPLDDTYEMRVGLYDAETGGNQVWGPEEHTAVEVSEGLFSVELGSKTDLPTRVFSEGDIWWQLTVEDETLSPREKVVAMTGVRVVAPIPDGVLSQKPSNDTREWYGAR